jgi:transposase-like protein
MGTKRNKKEASGFDYKSFEAEALSGLMSGKSLIGEGGILKGLIKHLVESALDGEMDAHLLQGKSEQTGNRRNGHTSKRLRTQLGEVEVSPPRDRDGSFEPQLVGKWDRELNSGLEEQIIELYSIGNSYEDIQWHVRRMYGVSLSKAHLSAVTDRVAAEVVRWQQRALKSFYILVYLDAICFKVRENGKVKDKAVYTVYGVDADGNRDVLGITVGESEGAKQWGRVLEKLRERGVEDVLFFAVDGLAGFKEAIYHVFPASIVQRCIVHMVRNALRFVDDADARPVAEGLKAIYTADDEKQGLQALAAFKAAWDGKYPEIGQAWQDNWLELTAFFGFSWAVRKLIYTTNAVEGLHRIMRKTTKTKSAFVSEDALLKLLYLTLERKKDVWGRQVLGYKAIQRCLDREFGERFSKHVTS